MTDSRALLEEISIARLVGTSNHARVREILKRELQARGFVVLEQRFRTRPRLPLWGRAAELYDYIREAGEQYGMQTFDQHLMDLVGDEVITYETALAAATKPADFELQMRTLRRRARTAEPAEAVPSPPRKR